MGIILNPFSPLRCLSRVSWRVYAIRLLIRLVGPSPCLNLVLCIWVLFLTLALCRKWLTLLSSSFFLGQIDRNSSSYCHFYYPQLLKNISCLHIANLKLLSPLYFVQSFGFLILLWMNQSKTSVFMLWGKITFIEKSSLFICMILIVNITLLLLGWVNRFLLCKTCLFS